MQLIAEDVCMHIYEGGGGGDLATTRPITCLIKGLIILPLRIFSYNFGKFMEKWTQIQPTYSGLYQQVHYFVNQNATL